MTQYDYDAWTYEQRPDNAKSPHIYSTITIQFKTETGEKCECFPDFPDRKSMADFDNSVAEFCRTKTGKSAKKSVANFGLHSSSKISLTMRFSFKNHS
ncbi:hypothetical protein MTR_7g045395 [Medicago truncatula]|uniref:Uncharacterized protein n=1 Tax=Medicago truncatula TaxID=3880 RepID=A0A072TY54_MEDTR|nr:hypothetical protein MTR_7g045395 [Medicago truncatula]